MQRLLDTRQAADALRLAKRTLEKWRVDGGGPEYRKHGDKVLYEEGALEAWSNARRRTSTSDAA